MRIRDKGFDDYGFDEDEEKQLKKYCRNSNFREHYALLQSAVLTNPVVASDLYYSIVTGLSYERLTCIRNICLPKNDFYGYQRKCLSIFKNLLTTQGKWKSRGNFSEKKI